MLIWKPFSGGVHAEHQGLRYLRNEKKNIPRSSRKCLYFHSLPAGHAGKERDSGVCLSSRGSGGKRPAILFVPYLLGTCKGIEHPEVPSDPPPMARYLAACLGTWEWRDTQLILRGVSLLGVLDSQGDSTMHLSPPWPWVWDFRHYGLGPLGWSLKQGL